MLEYIFKVIKFITTENVTPQYSIHSTTLMFKSPSCCNDSPESASIVEFIVGFIE